MILSFWALCRERIRKVLTSLTLKDRFVLSSLIFSLIANSIIIFYVWKNIKPSETPMALHYNIYFGIDYIDMWYKAYIIPFVGLLIFAVNFVLIYMLYLKEKLLSYILVSSTALVHIFLLISTYLIININQ